jgi:phosphate transport system protein
LNAEPPLAIPIDIPHLAKLALQLLKDTMDGFVNGDSGKALAVIPRDKEVDALNKQISQLLVNTMVADQSTITRALHLMTIAKSLERIADHATNIAEEVVYLYEGRDVRHLHVS